MLLITTGLLVVLIICQLGAAGGGGVVAEGAVDPGLGAIGAKVVPFKDRNPRDDLARRRARWSGCGHRYSRTLRAHDTRHDG